MQNIFGCYPEDTKSFNAKIKAFRRQLIGVTNLKFFFYRLTKLLHSPQTFAGEPTFADEPRGEPLLSPPYNKKKHFFSISMIIFAKICISDDYRGFILLFVHPASSNKKN